MNTGTIGKWVLVENNAQRLRRFTTKKALRDYARQHGLSIRRSPTIDCSFYSESVGYVPGNS